MFLLCAAHTSTPKAVSFYCTDRFVRHDRLYRYTKVWTLRGSHKSHFQHHAIPDYTLKDCPPKLRYAWPFGLTALCGGYRGCPAFSTSAAMMMKAITREIAPQRDERLHFTG